MRLKSFNLLKAASMRQLSLYRRLLKLNGCFLLERFGMTVLVPCSSSSSRNSALSYATLGALGQFTARYNDAQAMLVLGKTALARGLAMERFTFPGIGVPPYSPIGPQIDRCIVYSIVRTESAFDQRDVSPAKAVGLMQVTPEAGRDTAK
jgi:soluble lytic murein transglycosylase-like protein